MAAGDVRYEVIVTYALTPADDIDILDEGVYWRQSYESPVEALSDLGTFIQNNGGAGSWDPGDRYGVGSCWMPEREGIEISYQARMDRVRSVDGRTFPPTPEHRRPALLTWRRLDTANFGALGPADEHDPGAEIGGDDACPTR